MAKVKYENVTKKFGSFTAVNNFNLEIEDHEFLCLVGPSGCGKSTTLRMLAGLDQITEGTITIGDRIVNEVEPKERGIAMVFQSYALYPHYNVYDNLAFGLRAQSAKSAKSGKWLLLIMLLTIYLIIIPEILYAISLILNMIVFGFGNTIFIAGLVSYFVILVLYSDIRKTIRQKLISFILSEHKKLSMVISFILIGLIVAQLLILFGGLTLAIILASSSLPLELSILIAIIAFIIFSLIPYLYMLVYLIFFKWNPILLIREFVERENEIEEKISNTAKLLELEEQLYKKPKQLSGGQRQRVALGRAIIRNPRVFLLDEPLSNLDAKLRVQMRAELQRLSKRLGVTSIYVTHDQVEAMTLGHRIAVMNEGILQQIGTPDEVYLRPRNRFVAGFIGSPSMNFVIGKIEEKDTALYFMSDVLEYKIPERYKILKQHLNQEVIFGIRPEHIRVNTAGDDENRYQVTIGVSEPVGSDTFIYVDFPKPVIEKYVYVDFPKEFTMIVKLEGISTLKVDEEVEITFSTEQIHFFEKESEKRIEP